MAPGDKDIGGSAEKDKPDLITAFLMVIIYIIYPFYIAGKSQMGYWDLHILPKAGLTFNLNVFTVYVVWITLQCVLYIIPIGGKVEYGQQLRGGHRLQYRLNGFFALVVNIILFTLIGMSGVKLSAIADNIYEVVTVAMSVQFVISLLLMITLKPRHSYEINPVANRGNIIGDWLMGRSLYPRVREIDIKFLSFRSSVIAIALYNFSVLAQAIESNHGINFTLLVAIGMQLLYMADAMWFESSLLFMKETISEGCGFVFLLQAVAFPVGYSVLISYIGRKNLTLQWYWLMILVITYLLGYWIYRSSNEEKNDYRKNPHSARFKDYDAITTDKGKNLLVSGWWGMCRHPNYLGDITLNLAMGFLAGFNHVLPYLNPTLIVLFLLDREATDGVECKKKYGEYWDKYCHRVKYRLIPYIY